MRTFHGIRYATIVALSLVSGCGGGANRFHIITHGSLAASVKGPSTGRSISDEDIDKYIDVDLPKHDRKIMHQLMKELLPKDRLHVGFFAKNGTNYANTKGVFARMRRWKSSDGISFAGDNGKRFTGPLVDSKAQITALKAARRSASTQNRSVLGYEVPTPSDPNGPFRHVYSDAGYSREARNIYLPSGATNFNVTTGQTGYIYVGGFGQNDDGLDAGFQYSIANDSYALTNPNLGLMTVINATGNDLTGNYASETVMDPSNTDGFPMNGAGVRLKRMTSIAQVSNDSTNGATFGIAFDGTPTIAWSTCELGVFDPTNNTNTIFIWPEGNGGTQNYPDDASKIVVTYSEMADETDGVNLHP